MRGEKPYVAHWRDHLRDSDLRTTTKAVGFVLSTYMDHRGYAFPGKLTLARGASLSTKTKDSTAVGTAIDDMERARLLQVTRNRGRRGFEFLALIPRADGGFDTAESHTPPAVNPTRHTPKSHAPAWAKASESETQKGSFANQFVQERPVFDENEKTF